MRPLEIPGSVEKPESESPHSDLRNPPFEWRVALVAAAWMLPGVLIGSMVQFFVPLTPDAGAALAVGAALGAAVGAAVESLG